MQQAKQRAAQLCGLWQKFEKSDAGTASILRDIVLSICVRLTSSPADQQGDILESDSTFVELHSLLTKHEDSLNVDPNSTTSILFWINTLCLHFTAAG